MIVKEFFKERTDGVKLYRCLQDHTPQETWTPDAAPSLWVAISDPAEEWPAWVRPTGAHDAYAQGDKVSHNGKHWISNVWEPGATAGRKQHKSRPQAAKIDKARRFW